RSFSIGRRSGNLELAILRIRKTCSRAMPKPFASLSGLLDFEAAARHGGFRAAAAELHKTPAALSAQIKLLEQSL
ncbi:LysR family transcriptional regulator, partial [Thomasclavelia ramosa]|uniref:LysR family transcriptional regulator n=1 Tax=Thomasclavelia ramosa TaxID=1547 RepID=UPI001D05003D